jgi:mRNA interferase MazF
MLTSGDVIELDLGYPHGSEAGLVRPAVVVTADRILRANPTIIHVVPLTRTLRGYEAEITIEPDASNGLTAPSAAQCQHVRAVTPTRVRQHIGNIGLVPLAQIRETVAVLLDL